RLLRLERRGGGGFAHVWGLLDGVCRLLVSWCARGRGSCPPAPGRCVGGCEGAITPPTHAPEGVAGTTPTSCPPRRPTSPRRGSGPGSFAGLEQRVEPALEIVVTDPLVQFLAGLHQVDHVLLVAVAADRLVHGLGCPVHGPERRQRIQLDRHAGRGQLLAGEQRG